MEDTHWTRGLTCTALPQKAAALTGLLDCHVALCRFIISDGDADVCDDEDLPKTVQVGVVQVEEGV